MMTTLKETSHLYLVDFYKKHFLLEGKTKKEQLEYLNFILIIDSPPEMKEAAKELYNNIKHDVY